MCCHQPEGKKEEKKSDVEFTDVGHGGGSGEMARM
jgi:hypothetical protein